MDKVLKASDIIKKKGGARHAVLEVDLPELKLVVPIRNETMNSKDIKEKHKVVFKDSAGQEVKRKYVGEAKRLTWLSDSGTEAIGDVQAYQDGNAVAPFQKTEDIKILKTAPKEIRDNFLIERIIEIWSDDVEKLYKLADYLHTNSLVGLASVVLTQGYDTQYLAIIEPRFVEADKFGVLAYLCKKKIEFNHLLDLGEAVRRVQTTQARGLELIEGILL